MPTVQKNGYDLPRLNAGIEAFGYEPVYLDVTGSTMDDAKIYSLQKTVVIAGHQTAGRGRHKRDWEDKAGRSVLMTIVEPFDERQGDPAIDSILPGQVIVADTCVALQVVTGNSEPQIKWLNDWVARGKKLGGILIENTRYKGPDRPYPKLFGIGINVNYEHANKSFPDTDYGAISLREIAPEATFDLTDVVLAILKQWQNGRNDLRVIQSNPHVFNYHDKRWQGNASLPGCTVEVAKYGPARNQTIVGKVLSTPLNRGLVLVDASGKECEIKNEEYHTETTVKVLEAA